MTTGPEVDPRLPAGSAAVHAAPHQPYPAPPAAGWAAGINGYPAASTPWYHGDPYAGPPASAIPAPPPHRRIRTATFWWAALRWAAAVATLAALVALAVVAIGQDRRIDRLRQDLAGARHDAAAAGADADRRLDALERQSAALDKRSRQVFDPRAVAASVLPSVFLVIADDARGSAFAIGRSEVPGKTNVLTAYHVVERIWTSSRTTVQLERDDRTLTATITRVNRSHDLALLTVDTKLAGIPAAKAAPVSGEQILVVGAPLGLADTVTTGVVSAIRPHPDGPGTVIQFDASINPGNSGGPVINTRKEVVGIADAKARDAEGIGLAVPIQTACKAFKVC